MSYTVRDFQSISGTVSGSYDYPASENGGSGSITVDWEEGVDIQVTVNDDPFQSSVRSCKQNIDLMTASVVATEVAQLASKAEAAKKISAGVVKGFFGLIQSEINQQMTELSASLGPKIQEINNISTRCLALKQQMEADFHRIRDRYIRLFGDLDQELNKRIRNLDRHAFSLRQISADPTGDSAKSKHVTTPMVSGQETHVVQTQLLTHSIRQGALSIIASANKSIIAGERLNKDMQTIREDIETEIQQQLLIPFVFVEQENIDGGKVTRIVFPEGSPFEKELIAKKEVCIDKTAGLAPLTQESKSRVNDSLSQLIINYAKNASDTRRQRESEMVQKLWSQMNVQGETK